jgi:hypothetical protein
MELATLVASALHITGQYALVAEAAWTFQVEAAFTLTGRGVGVIGTLSGEVERVPIEAWLCADGEVTRLDVVSIELALLDRREQFALVLRGIDSDQIPAGSVISSSPPGRP